MVHALPFAAQLALLAIERQIAQPPTCLVDSKVGFGVRSWGGAQECQSHPVMFDSDPFTMACSRNGALLRCLPLVTDSDFRATPLFRHLGIFTEFLEQKSMHLGDAVLMLGT